MSPVSGWRGGWHRRSDQSGCGGWEEELALVRGPAGFRGKGKGGGQARGILETRRKVWLEGSLVVSSTKVDVVGATGVGKAISWRGQRTAGWGTSALGGPQKQRVL